MEDVVRWLERLQRGETEEEEKSRWLTRRKQQIWDDQYKKGPRPHSQSEGPLRSFLHSTRDARPQTRDPRHHYWTTLKHQSSCRNWKRSDKKKTTSWKTGTRHLDPPGRGPRIKHSTRRPSHGTRRTSESQILGTRGRRRPRIRPIRWQRRLPQRRAKQKTWSPRIAYPSW